MLGGGGPTEMEYPWPVISALESQAEESTWIFEEVGVKGGTEDVEETEGQGEKVSKSLERNRM
jgi:hypothetical protein